MNISLNKTWYDKVKDFATNKHFSDYERIRSVTNQSERQCVGCKQKRLQTDFLPCGPRSVFAWKQVLRTEYQSMLCLSCVNELYKQLLQDSENTTEKTAILRLCIIFDLPYVQELVDDAVGAKKHMMSAIYSSSVKLPEFAITQKLTKGVIYWLKLSEDITMYPNFYSNLNYVDTLKLITKEAASVDEQIVAIKKECNASILAMEKEVDAAEKSKEATDAKNADLAQKLTEANIKISELTAQRSIKEAKMADQYELEAQVEKLKAKIKELESKNGDLVRINHDYKTENDEKKRELNELKKSIVKKISVGEGDKQQEKYVVQLLSETGRQQRSQIVQVFHCDPFENDAIEDREAMYTDLITMMDDSMSDDLVRQKAAIEIVRAFKRIDKISDTIRELQTSSKSIMENDKVLKSLVDQKAKETALVTSFSKDHGFAEKYATSKAKGTGTLSAIVREMDEAHYDRGTCNAYDIETATAIKQISDISMESVFKQLNFTESEYAEMVKEQRETIMDLTAKNKKNQELVRILKEKITKEELLAELEFDLRNKGISDKDVKDILGGEYFQRRYGKDDKK